MSERDGSTPREPGEGLAALTGDGQAVDPASEEDPLARREASIRLRSAADRAGSDATLMDPAHQSLADALRITLRIVQFAMLVLIVFFLFSGARTIREGESGVRLMFGRVQAEDLAPGLQFSWPFPIGDLIKVETGNQQLTIAQAFWPEVDEQGRPMGINELRSGRSALDPARAGSLITADENLVHTTWSVTYRRLPERASRYVRNMHPESEEQIIRAAVRRGIVHAVARHDIEEVLKEVGGGSLALQAKRRAQDMLDGFESGIAVETLNLEAVTPPKAARAAFERVFAAEPEANQKITDAESEAEQRLLSTAGQAYRELLPAINDRFRPAADAYQLAVDTFLEHMENQGITSPERAEEVARLVDRYEALHARAVRAEARGDEEEAAALRQQRATARDRITEVVPGSRELIERRAELSLEREQAIAEIHEIFQSPGIGGEVARIINDAEFYAQTEGTRRQGDLAIYRARLDQFRRNPLVTIHSDWSDAVQTFMSGDQVQAMIVPPGTGRLVIDLNKDPEVARRQERAAKERTLEQTRQERERQRRMSRYETDTSTQELDAR